MNNHGMRGPAQYCSVKKTCTHRWWNSATGSHRNGRGSKTWASSEWKSWKRENNSKMLLARWESIEYLSAASVKLPLLSSTTLWMVLRSTTVSYCSLLKEENFSLGAVLVTYLNSLCGHTELLHGFVYVFTLTFANLGWSIISTLLMIQVGCGCGRKL